MKPPHSSAPDGTTGTAATAAPATDPAAASALPDPLPLDPSPSAPPLETVWLDAVGGGRSPAGGRH